MMANRIIDDLEAGMWRARNQAEFNERFPFFEFAVLENAKHMKIRDEVLVLTLLAVVAKTIPQDPEILEGCKEWLGEFHKMAGEE